MDGSIPVSFVLLILWISLSFEFWNLLAGLPFGLSQHLGLLPFPTLQRNVLYVVWALRRSKPSWYYQELKHIISNAKCSELLINYFSLMTLLQYKQFLAIRNRTKNLKCSDKYCKPLTSLFFVYTHTYIYGKVLYTLGMSIKYV